MTRKIILLLGGLFMLSMGCSVNKIDRLGLKNGKLTPCPASPNCVSSQSDDKDRYVKPLTYASSPDEAYKKLEKVIQNMKRTKIIKESENYVHVQITSTVLRFVDDVEFFFDNDKKVIHLRSASRIGYYDFGANRKRVELIRTMFETDK